MIHKKFLAEIKSLIYDIQYKKYYLAQIDKIKKLKNIHKGKRCFILGNGPSLKKQNLTLLKNEYVFVTNHFVHHEQLSEINPNFYCASDINFFKPVINQDWLENLKRLPNSCKLFFTYRSFKAINSVKLFDIYDIYLLRYLPKKIWEYNTFSYNVEDFVYSGDTVIIDFCIPLAIYMGFQNIYLMGVDTNYNIRNGKIEYAFDTSKVTTNRRSDKYLKSKWRKNVITSYQIVKNNINSIDVNIFDATLKGKLNVFEKVNYEDIINSSI